MVGSVAPDDVKDALVKIACIDLGKKLDSTGPINGCRFDKRRIKCFEVQSTMNVDAATSRCGLHSRASSTPNLRVLISTVERQKHTSSQAHNAASCVCVMRD